MLPANVVQRAAGFVKGLVEHEIARVVEKAARKGSAASAPHRMGVNMAGVRRLIAEGAVAVFNGAGGSFRRGFQRFAAAALGDASGGSIWASMKGKAVLAP